MDMRLLLLVLAAGLDGLREKGRVRRGTRVVQRV
jgi:hypothetical protein